MCCYSDAKDCDMGKHWCSSSADKCLDCGGDYMCVKAEDKIESKSEPDDETASLSHPKAQPVMLAASAPTEKPVMLASAPGQCCYSGPKDCDGVKDWCSKDATHCEKCQGIFYNGTDLDLAEVAEPLMLAAEVPKVPNKEGPGHCCYSGRTDCDGSMDWCSKGESHCTKCGGTFHAIEEAAAAASKDPVATQMAALPLELAAVSNAHAQQADTRTEASSASSASGGDWERYIPTEYRSFFKSKMEDAHRHAPRNGTEASSASEASSATASAFLGAQTGSLASDTLSLPALACLSVVGLVLVMKAAVRANMRKVSLQTELLG